MREPQPQPDPPERLAALPSWIINQVAIIAHRLVNEALAEAGVRRQHFAVLLALAERGATSQAELGRRLRLDRSDLHAILEDLTARSFVTRVRDQHDRRRVTVELSDAGARELARLDAKVLGAQDALLEPLPAGERRALTSLLTRLQRHHAADNTA